MSKTFLSTQGIILKAIPFRDSDQILSLFTLDAGLIKVLCKGSRSKRQVKRGFYNPLTGVEIVYCEKRGEIFSCHEMNCVESFSYLRKELLFLEVACDLLKVILASQYVGKAAPQLYALLCFYLKKIPQAVNPWILATSFRLKLLNHDGLIAFPWICSECQTVLDCEAFTRNGESWCANHKPLRSQSWDTQELQALYQLATSQSYREISSYEISHSLQNKVINFFDANLA